MQELYSLSLFWGLPFGGVLLSLALFPLFAEKFWHHNYGKIMLAWACAFMIPFSLEFDAQTTFYHLMHAILHEYVPFILLLFALFTVSSGIHLVGHIRGTPAVNSIFLLIGTFFASFMGTTGASMLLIRPLIKANQYRANKTHIVVFFIFLVSNIGGSLTPLGDPPLFLGFLAGVDFLWTMEHMFFPLIVTSFLVLSLFFLIDHYFYSKSDDHSAFVKIPMTIRFEGKVNFLFLFAIVLIILSNGLWQNPAQISLFGIKVSMSQIVSNLLLLIVGLLSYFLTSSDTHQKNGFNWAPLIEVSKVFAAIFITIIPMLAILKQGEDGALGNLIRLVSNEMGEPVPMMYFWLTGLLSSFLDNAPTYLIFFNTAGGDAEILMTIHAQTLLAISCGAVFMGAVTYIGNAPNFMVKSIAEHNGVTMPSFFGYMAWSIVILIPIFFILSWIFFR